LLYFRVDFLLLDFFVAFFVAFLLAFFVAIVSSPLLVR
jgi:hypothetical protein